MADVAEWEADLEELTDGLRHLFRRTEPHATFKKFIRGLPADVARKNAWELAEYAGLDTPRPVEHLLDLAVWDVEELRAVVRDLVVENLGDGRDSVVVIDDTQVIKQRTESVGVSRQHCGATGQVENCQVWVMMSMASRHGHAFFDREPCMPEPWIDDPVRRAVAAVPADRGFMTEPGLAVPMPGRATADGVTFGWVAGDSGHGCDPGLRQFCHDNTLRYVMAVAVDPPLVEAGEPSRCDTVPARTTDDLWERGSQGDGTKGTRLYDWSLHHVHAENRMPSVGFEHTPPIRRSKEEEVTKKHPEGVHEIDYFPTHAPARTPMPIPVRIAGFRWRIEENDGQAEDLSGMGRYQVRKWTPTIRHVTTAMLASAFPASCRSRLGKSPTPGRTTAKPIRVSVRTIRTLMALTSLLKDIDIAGVPRRLARCSRHMSLAMINHYRRRGDLLPIDLAMIDRECRTVDMI